jgi:hypothetical protein
MKKFLLLYKILFVSLPAFAQLTIAPGAQWINNGSVTVNLSNLNMINNGTFSAGNSTMKFTGNTSNNIGGSSANSFYQIEIAKNSNSKVVLLSQINVGSQVNFTSGFLDLNQQNLFLAAGAIFNNEGENTRMIAPNGGEAIITVNLNAPNAVNPGNLGATISTIANLGQVTIKRGHLAQSGAGLNGSILRYYSITPQTNAALNATLRLRYFDSEKNAGDENNFVIFQSDDGSNWANQSQTNRNTSSDFVEKSGLNNLSKFTLSDNVVAANCSASGVVLSVKVGKQNNVNVSWSTATETNNQGFAVERRLKGEADFIQLAFVNSQAAGGNSVTTLSYSYSDANSSADTSYYRLKTVGLNANTCYSDIKFIVPKGGGKKGNLNIISTDTVQTTATNKKILSKETNMTAKLTVGPNPNNGNFWFTVNGIERETFATLYTMDGKILKQFRVMNLQQQQVNGLKSGIYILKVEGLRSFRVVVQTDGNPSTNFPVINLSSIKN